MSTNTAFVFDDLPRGNGGFGATEQIARVLINSGINAPDSLFDEALNYAQEGKLAAATERLRMLLCLDPNDAEASLLLGKVLAARRQWQESLSYLDAAVARGAILPPGLREQVESSLRKKIQAEEEHRAQVAAREQREIQQLRREAKRLRSDNAALDAHIDELQKRVRVWSGVTAVVAGAASALLLASLIFGSSSEENIEEMAAVDNPAVLDEAAATISATEITSTETATTTEATAATTTVAVTTTETEAETVTSSSAVEAPVEVAQAEVTPSIDFPAYHTVENGDTLGAIAEKYYKNHTLHDHIRHANGMSSNSLRVGQTLKIPAPPSNG